MKVFFVSTHYSNLINSVMESTTLEPQLDM